MTHPSLNQLVTVAGKAGSHFLMSMSTSLRHAALVIALLTASACRDGVLSPALVVATARVDSVLVRDDAAFFQTDSLNYTLRRSTLGYEVALVSTFTNRSAGTVYFVNCGGATAIELERLTAGRWTRVWSGIWNACLSPALTVDQGRTRDFRLWVFGGYPGSNTVPQFFVANPAGIYRAVWTDALRSYQSQLPFGDALPLSQRVSNRFALIVEPE